VTPGAESIVTLFERLAGPSLPVRFMRWPMISVVAAALANRTWVEVRRGGFTTHIRPNLYTLIVGPSGGAKSLGIHFALDMLRQCEGVADRLRLYPGSITAKGMLDQMVPTASHPQNDKMFLVQDELASDIGSTRETADPFVKVLTKMYYLEPFEEMTRTSGHTDLSRNRYDSFGYCLNVLWATTPTWLFDCIPENTIDSGFWPRVCTIIESNWLRPRFDPQADPQAEATKAEIITRLEQIMWLEGQFEVLPAAYEWLREWFEGRADPTTDTERAYFARERDWLEKLAMNHVAATRRDDELVIDVADYEAAAKLVADAGESPRRFLRGRGVAMGLSEKLAVSPNGATRSEVLTWAHRQNMRKYDVDDTLDMLIEAGMIVSEVVPGRGRGRPMTRYRWVGEPTPQGDDNGTGQTLSSTPNSGSDH